MLLFFWTVEDINILPLLSCYQNVTWPPSSPFFYMTTISCQNCLWLSLAHISNKFIWHTSFLFSFYKIFESFHFDFTCLVGNFQDSWMLFSAVITVSMYILVQICCLLISSHETVSTPTNYFENTTNSIPNQFLYPRLNIIMPDVTYSHQWTLMFANSMKI